MQLSNIEDRNYRKLPSRARYTASSAYSNGILESNLFSDRQKLLNGKWKDINSTAFDETIQNLVGKMPPVAEDQHQLIPVAAFLHPFSYQMDTKAPLTYLYFSAANTGYYVWLNGKFLGSHDLADTPAEFDLSGIITEGENLLEVLVTQWQDRSDFQGQMGYTGKITFPEVYLLSRPEQHIWDYFITTRVIGSEANVSVHFSFHEEAIPASVRLLDEFGQAAATTKLRNDVCNGVWSRYATLSVHEPQLWGPEKPFFYTLVVETANEVLAERVALRDLRVEDDCVYLNGRPVTFRNCRTKELI